MPTAVTNNVRITVQTQYSADHSAPPYRYFFAYHVTIANEGEAPVQLLSRRWVIKDANGRVQVVEGPGVVGEQPRILPGESYEYTSGCPLPTAYGEMKGWYRMVDDDGDSFNAIIPTFKMIVVHDTSVN
ncbi:MAG: Co2+/Mg2+ efflux protein ApaG [Deltaproteobacteria bacterium]|nr:Co2+/Mg2+ efflux protein ApaG [Deltaproteobacteria bacterium]MCB9479632.1 Co2+/Mg2+ efflux protein ApaG [Deltaproteobacteria bacterium]MCB9489871.1 Co2+/Mg2+ efflux protein ApaG [Deltaproteobacteria bacterium]